MFIFRKKIPLKKSKIIFSVKKILSGKVFMKKKWLRYEMKSSFLLYIKRKNYCIKLICLFLEWLSPGCSPLKIQCWTNLFSLYSWHVHMFVCTWLFVLHLYVWGERYIYMYLVCTFNHWIYWKRKSLLILGLYCLGAQTTNLF